MARARSSDRPAFGRTAVPEGQVFYWRVLLMATLIVLAIPICARADYRICNRTSYVLDAALAIEQAGATATQGWFRIRPGECSTILAGKWTGERYFLHTRTPALYGETSQPGNVSRMYCVRRSEFLIAGAEHCEEGAGELAPFTEVVPDRASPTTTTELTDESSFDLEQARIAGIQRLLALNGHDPAGINGVQSDLTTAALTAFVRDQRLDTGAISGPRLFDALMATAEQRARATGVTLCNDMDVKLIAAFGLSDIKGPVVKGWYELAPGTCEQVSHKPVTASPVYAYAEAVDDAGKTASRDGKPLVWAGDAMLCTKSMRFEFSGASDCEAKGWNATPFRSFDTLGQASYTVRFQTENR